MSKKYRFVTFLRQTKTFNFFVDTFDQITAIFHTAELKVNAVEFSGALTFSDLLALLTDYDSDNLTAMDGSDLSTLDYL